MAATASAALTPSNPNAELICSVRKTMPVSLTLLGLNSPLSKEQVLAGSPKITQDAVSGSYQVFLYGKLCGTLDDQMSKFLTSVTSLKLARMQALVGVDVLKANHIFVLVNLSGTINSATSVFMLAVKFLGPLFDSCVIVPPAVALQPGIRSILGSIRKRPLHSSLSSNILPSSVGPAVKQLKLSQSAPLISQSPLQLQPSILNLIQGNSKNVGPKNPVALNLQRMSNANVASKTSGPVTPVPLSSQRPLVTNKVSSDILIKHVPNTSLDIPTSNRSNLTGSVTTAGLQTSTLHSPQAMPYSHKQNHNLNAAIGFNNSPSNPSPPMSMDSTQNFNAAGHLTTISPLLLEKIKQKLNTVNQAAVSQNHIANNILSQLPKNSKQNVSTASQITVSNNSAANESHPTSVYKPIICQASGLPNILSNDALVTTASHNQDVSQTAGLIDFLPKTLNLSIKKEPNLDDIPKKAAGLQNSENNSLSELGDNEQDDTFALFMRRFSQINDQTTLNNNIRQPTSDFSLQTTIEGEPTKLSDLPADIMNKLKAFTQDVGVSRKSNSNEGSLLNEQGSSGKTCGFLLGRVELPANASSNSQSATAGAELRETENDSDDSEEELKFSVGMLARHRKKRNPCAHIGADNNELYEDPADVAYRNWGHVPTSSDPADVMFNDTPPPVIEKNELDELFDAMSEFDKNTEAEPSPAVRQKLLKHQKVALHWMIERENTKELPPFWSCVLIGRDYFNVATRKRIYEKPECVNGGILADDMGLGKTLTAIALILTNHIDGKPMFSGKKLLPVEAHEISEGDDIHSKKKVSLDIKRKKDGYVTPKTVTKSEYNKPGFKFRQMYLQQLGKNKKKKKKKDKEKDKDKEEKKKDNSMFLSDSDDDEKDLKHVNKHVSSIINSPAMFYGTKPATKEKPMFGGKADDRKATLIVCPMSVLSNWTTQFQQHVDASINLQIYVFYGPERVRDVNYLKKYDIILTTYGTLTCDYRSKMTKGKDSPLHKINWLRIVLDEGHIIRNARSQQTAAMMALNASRRWLLTGTPIQNRMTDLWSMVKFLRLEPFTNRKWWFTYVVESMKRESKRGQWFNRVNKIIKHVAIRRMKTDKINGKPLVNLPERTVIVNKIQFSEEERKIYDAMQKDGKLIVCKYFRMGMNTVMKNYANVLAIIMRLRQLCCHPKLCAKAVEKLQKAMDLMDQLRDQFTVNDTEATDGGLMSGEPSCDISEEEREKLIQQLMQLLSAGDSEECSICLENLKDPIITRCAHVFCTDCINEVIETAEPSATCPLCRADIDTATMVKVPQINQLEETDGENNEKSAATSKEIEDDEPWHTSAKIDFLMKALQAQRDKDPHMKSLVVSQFTSFLDVLEKPLKEAGFDFVRLDGKLSQVARTRVIDEFSQSSDYAPTIMLLSLTAGGVGLNLIAANRVFLLDPAWNPAVEEQCFDRCHRLGQTKDVRIIKVIVEDTVEDRMLILQQQKRELMQKAFGMAVKGPEERRAAALRDISTLLGLDLPGVGRLPPADGSGPSAGRSAPMDNRRSLYV